MELYNLVSFFGIFVLAGFAWLCSNNRRVVNWRVVFWGIALQFLFAFFIFIVPVGAKIFIFVNNVVVAVLDSATAGTIFLFGPLALSQEEGGVGYVLAFQALPTVVFFAAVVGALYYLRIMPLLIRGFSYVFTRLMRIIG